MLTKRFEILRKKDLDLIFDRKKIPGIWRDRVKQQLRDAAILDLYDYYDFNYDIDDKSSNIRDLIIGGRYKSNPPLFYRIEKKLGITRLLVLPHPSDCLILEIIISSFFYEIINHSPSKKSFFVRTMAHKNIEDFDGGDQLSWKGQWKKFQNEILLFNDEFSYVVTTDLSNYYDSIDINELKSVLLGQVKIPEVLVDILFNIIRDIAWSPDYLPYRDRGLPTANVDAIRLLAHQLLFEIDSYLKDATNNNFVRWMDDIVFGCNSITQGKNFLSDISSMLNSRGLALNLAKTSILPSEDILLHYQVEANKYINSIDKKIKNNESINKIELNSKFRKHLKDKRAKLWDKITKRYFTIFKKIKSKNLLNYSTELFIEHPSLRPNILYYLSSFKTDIKIKKIYSEITSNTYHDDVTYFLIAKSLTDLNLERTKVNFEFINEIIKRFPKFDNPLDFYSQLWIKTKYENNDNLMNFITRFENYWIKYPFLHRQVVASTIRIYIPYKDRIEKLYNKLVAIGSNDSIMLIKLLERFRVSNKVPESRVFAYLFPNRKSGYYELSRFLVLCSFLNRQHSGSLEKIVEKIPDSVNDHFYHSILEANYGLILK